jgi:hypothetical protein
MKLKVAGLVWSVVLAAVACDATAQGWVDVTPASSPVGFRPTSGAFDPSRNLFVVRGVFGAGGPVSTFSSVVYTGTSVTVAPIPAATGASNSDASTVYFDPQYGAVVAVRTDFVASSFQSRVELFDGSNWAVTPCQNSSLGYQSATFDAARGKSFYVDITSGTANRVVLGSLPQAGSCPNYLTVSPLQQPLGSPLRAFYDYASQRPVLWTLQYQTVGGPLLRSYEWNGSNWIQRFPTWPTSNDIGALSLVTQSSQPEGAMVTSYSLVNGSITPRTFRYRNGIFTEQFLTSYPPETGTTVYIYDSTRDVFVAFLDGGGIWELNLGPSAQFSTFGAGCLGSRSTPALAPQQGNLPRVGTSFTLQALNLPLAGPVFLAIGASDTLYGPTPLPLNLGPLGAPQCNLLIGIDNLYPTSNVLGAAAWTFPIPNIPGGIFFSQAVVFDPPANTFGLTLSNGGRGVIGS